MINRSSLTLYAWLSVSAAVATIGLKTAAWVMTGSVGLLSDALESLVNLAGALMALTMLSIAERPADENHAYGHGKAEYFASGAEGALILTASAALINLAVALVLLKAARRHQSVTLEANAQHLLTDVWTTAGVLAGVGAVAMTGWQRLDPLVALVVAGNIVRAGVRIVREAVSGLMDTALPVDEQHILRDVLEQLKPSGVQYHDLRTRRAGRRRFVSLHVLVPGSWTVQRGHELLERIESDIRCALPEVEVITHLESLEDPASWEENGRDK
jgi:divalent metal cation (Fe/Co/Zn/Cd) transporter